MPQWFAEDLAELAYNSNVPRLRTETYSARSSVSACFSPKAALRCRSASAFASSAAAMRASALWRTSSFLLAVSSACSSDVYSEGNGFKTCLSISERAGSW